jgi:phenol 2-monooxygenase (NADPH)
VQFYLNGYRPGDPRLLPAAAAATRALEGAADEVDVLIAGCGPAGLVLAAQLSAFPTIKTRIVDRKTGPLELGQADGIACRTVEMFQAFGFAQRLLEEAYWVNETVFWRPDPDDRTKIVRSGRIQDTEDGLSEFPHVIVNQARVHDYLLQVMRESSTRLVPHYNRHVKNIKVGESGDFPVAVTLQRMEPDHQGQEEIVRARYVVGCDGARSSVRQSIGRALVGDVANQAWGVMDVLAVTDFPDIRLKSVIHSANEGNVLIIPREGGYLVRFYIELDKLNPDQHLTTKDITTEKLIAAANRVMHPYIVDVKDIAWWSVYEIGQRLCDKFDDVPQDEMKSRFPRVFIAGDACHTHSAKAGQGMNVSMQDTFNLGWKLASVLQGKSAPTLLHTYSAERQAIAKELIEFDREFARMFSAPPKESGSADGEGVDPQEFQSSFVAAGRFTAGTATRYKPSPICAETTFQHLATGFPIGMRFHSAPVVRLVDAKPMQLGHAGSADGAWRIYVFADAREPQDPASRFGALCRFLDTDESPVKRFTPSDDDIDSVIDFRAVLQQGHRGIAVNAMPRVLLPKKGRFALTDYEKIFCPDLKAGTDIFEMRGIDRQQGCMVVVRPDQYVAHVLPLHGFDTLAEFFAAFMIEPRPHPSKRDPAKQGGIERLPG